MGKLVISVLSVVLCLFVHPSLYGQEALSKNVYSLAGTAQYSLLKQTDNYSTYTQKTGTISPQFTYFIADHISLGAVVSYNYYYSKEPGGFYGDRVTNTSYLSLGPVGRYYFNVKKIIPFLEASLSYCIYGLEQDFPLHAFSYGIKGGVEVFLSKSVALEPTIGYSHIKYSQDAYGYSYSENTNTTVFGIGMNYFIF